MVKMTRPPKMVLIPNTNTFLKLLNCFRRVAMVLSLGHHFFPPSSHLRFSGNDSGGSFSITSPGWSWSDLQEWIEWIEWIFHAEILRLRFLSFWDCLFLQRIFTGSRRMTLSRWFFKRSNSQCWFNSRPGKSPQIPRICWVIPGDTPGGHMVTLASTPSHSCRTCEFPSSSCTILPCTRLEITVNVVFLWDQ